MGYLVPTSALVSSLCKVVTCSGGERLSVSLLFALDLSTRYVQSSISITGPAGSSIGSSP
jgi:hypothetical protein